MIKLKKLTFIICITLLTHQTNVYADFFNKFKTGFYFEKYDTADEAEKALLKLHPIGSDVDALLSTYNQLGGDSCYATNRPKLNDIKQISNSNSDFYLCAYYNARTNLVCTTRWHMIVRVKPSDYSAIAKTEIYRQYYCFK